MALLKFYWLRHAPPINPGNICYGADMTVDLTDIFATKRQAGRLPYGADWKASPLPRTMDTAKALAYSRPLDEGSRISIEQRDRLKEQLFGDWVGKPRLALRGDPAFEAYRADPVTVAPPNGESLSTFVARVDTDIDDIVAAKPQGGNCVIVAHAGTIRAAISKATGMSISDTLHVSVSPLSLTVITYDIDKKVHGKNPWALESINLKP